MTKHEGGQPTLSIARPPRDHQSRLHRHVKRPWHVGRRVCGLDWGGWAVAQPWRLALGWLWASCSQNT